MVEDLLNREAVLEWREQDAVTAAENRRRAAWKAKLTRSQKVGGEPASAAALLLDGEERPNLLGWEEFERDGLLG